MRENMRDLTPPELDQCAGGAFIGGPEPVDGNGLVKIPRPINLDPPIAPPVKIPVEIRLE